MSRYIDADKLLASLPNDLPYKASVKRVLIQAPTADVVEVRHGGWHSYEGYCECTLCHHKYVNTSLYCPNCGAKMKGENND